MRQLVCADIHLNINRRFEDTLDALEQIYQLVVKYKVDLVTILGDVYTNRRPHSKEKTMFQRWIRKLTKSEMSGTIVAYKGGVDVDIVIGNHDEYPDGIHSYSEFTELKFPRVTVYDNPTVVNNFFLGHMLLKEAKLGPIDYQSPNCMSATELIAKYPNCEAYLLGDVHKAQVIQKDPLVIYAGSINRVDFGERNDEKSVLLINDSPEFKCKRIVLKSRRMIQYDIECKVGEDNDWKLVDKDEMKDAIVKVIYHGTVEALREVDEKNVREFLTTSCQCKEVMVQYDVHKESIARDERVNENITPKQALELYLEQIDLSHEEKTAIIELSQKVMEDATA